MMVNQRKDIFDIETVAMMAITNDSIVPIEKFVGVIKYNFGLGSIYNLIGFDINQCGMFRNKTDHAKAGIDFSQSTYSLPDILS